MVVLVKPYGNHTNRLIQNAHIEAFCKEEDIPYSNVSLCPMARYYPVEYHYGKAVYYYALWKTHRFPFVEFNDITHIEEYKAVLRSHRQGMLFVGGWMFRDYEVMKRQRAYLRQRYETHKSAPQFESLVRQLSQYDVVLGIHVRRGDYKHWQDGKYFFSYETYTRILNDFVSLFPGRLVFSIIFSNEKLSPQQMQINTPHAFSHLPYYLDHKLMGHCHYLLGPPSTFTLWPSFLYEIPYLHVEDPQQSFCLSDFHCAKG